MIPWVDLQLTSLGPLRIHLFGVLVGIGGFVMAHLFDVVAYQTADGAVRWIDVLDPFAGLSSFGGFAGAVAALFVWARRRGERVAPYADSLAFGLAPGWMFGRLGCFTAHDHPGRLTNFFLGVRYPGGVRHFLRARDVAGADARYLGLTPAQYGCLLLLVAGALLTNALAASMGSHAARA